MPPKKQLKNGFYCFCIEFREEQEHMGIEMPRSMKELMTFASGHWNKLNPTQKAYYNKQAKALNGQRDKMNCTGRLIKEIEQEKEEMRAKEEGMIHYIATHVRNFGDTKNASQGKYYMISFNIFCKTTNDMYLPAEVGLVEFSLERGILNTYHSFIDPGNIPLGYTFECKHKSEMTHKIPWLNFEFAEKDYAKIANKIIDFIDPEHHLQYYPPIYCHKTEMEQNKALIDVLMKGVKRRVDFTVYDVAHLFYELHCFARQDMISVGLIRDYFNSNAYMYAEDTSCQWHSDNDCIEHCALGVAKRSCYTMFDYLCPLYNIRPVPRKHMPVSKQLPIDTMVYKKAISSDRHSSASSFRSNSTMSGSYLQSEYDSNYDTDSSVRMGSNRQCSSGNYGRTAKTSDHASSFVGENSDRGEASYFTPSASPQYQSASGDGGQSGWKAPREPRTQSFSAAAASSSSRHANDFHVSDNNFPSLGRGSGGVRPKQSRQQFYSDERYQNSSTTASSASRTSYQDEISGSGYGRGMPRHYES